jgi:hypothetical protein
MKTLYLIIIISASLAIIGALANLSSNHYPITISAQNVVITYEKCESLKEDVVINGTIGVPQNNIPVQITIYYPNGTIYDSRSISSQDISPIGNYKYWFSLMFDDKTTFGSYNVTVSYNGQSAHTSIHPVVPPGPIQTITNDIRIVDMNGQSISYVKPGQQVQIQDILQPICDTSKFVYVLQILGKNQMTDSLSWLAVSNQNVPMNFSQTWTPFYQGTYTVNRFVWQNLTNPNSILPPSSHMIEVR